jgi:putative Mn2+ efflux pump MntP
MTAAIKILVVALALAMDVFAVSVGVGVRGVPNRDKLRIGATFAAAEVVMTCIGAGLGLVVGRLLGNVAGYLGFFALLGLGLYMVWDSVQRKHEHALNVTVGWGLLITALSVSLDSLGIGFSILYLGVPLPVALLVIGSVSVCATAVGITMGGRIGAKIGEKAEVAAGALLALTGLAFILFKALHLG